MGKLIFNYVSLLFGDYAYFFGRNKPNLLILYQGHSNTKIIDFMLWRRPFTESPLFGDAGEFGTRFKEETRLSQGRFIYLYQGKETGFMSKALPLGRES